MEEEDPVRPIPADAVKDYVARLLTNSPKHWCWSSDKPEEVYKSCQLAAVFTRSLIVRTLGRKHYHLIQMPIYIGNQ